MTTSYRNYLYPGLKAHLLRDGFGEVYRAKSFMLPNPILSRLNAIFDYSRPESFIAAIQSQTWGKAEMLYAVKSISSGRDYLQIKPFAALRVNGLQYLRLISLASSRASIETRSRRRNSWGIRLPQPSRQANDGHGHAHEYRASLKVTQ